EYGQRLFDRKAKSVRLPPAGEVVLDYARQLLALQTKSLHAVSEQSGNCNGTLSNGANEGTFLYVLPATLAKYHKQFPRVKISVYRSFTHKVTEKVEDGSIDLAVVTMPVKSQSLEVVPVFRDRILLMVGPASPLFGRASATLQEAAAQPIILPRTGSIRKLFETGSSPVADAALDAHSKQQGSRFAGIRIPVIRDPRAAADHALLSQRYVGPNPAALGKRRGERFAWSYDPARDDRRYCRRSLPSLKLTCRLWFGQENALSSQGGRLQEFARHF